MLCDRAVSTRSSCLHTQAALTAGMNAVIRINHNKSNTLKLRDKNIVRNNLLTRSKVRPAKYGSSIASNQSEIKATLTLTLKILLLLLLLFIGLLFNTQKQIQMVECIQGIQWANKNHVTSACVRFGPVSFT